MIPLTQAKGNGIPLTCQQEATAIDGVGERIRAAREVKGLSGNALALAAGISQGHLRDIETGRIRDPGVSVVQALARALGVTVDELLREEGGR